MDEKKQYYRFFQNRQCEYFPCHEGVPAEEFNCLFCYCPLYALGKKCGGHCSYQAAGYKDCSGCTVPHRKDNYDLIISRYGEIVEVVAQMDAKEAPQDEKRLDG